MVCVLTVRKTQTFFVILLRRNTLPILLSQWHSSPNLLKTIPSHIFSEHVCRLPPWWLDDINHFRGRREGGGGTNLKRCDLPSWIRVLSYLAELSSALRVLSLSLGENWHRLLLPPQSSLSPIIPGTKLPWHWVNPGLFQFCFWGRKTDKEFR